MATEFENLIDNEMLNAQRAPATQQDSSSIDNQISSEIDKEIQEEMFGTTGQKLIGFGEAIGRGLLTSPISTGIEEALGVPAENIKARKEQLGGLGEFVGEGVGLVLPALATAGTSSLARAGLAPVSLASKAQSLARFSQAGLLNSVGEMAAKKAVTDAGKKALAMGLETAVFAAGDEIAKEMLSEHPSASLERLGSAAINIGASALMGGALGFGIGKVSPLWKEKFGPQLTEELNKVDSQIATSPDDFVKVSEKVMPDYTSKEILDGLSELKPNAKQIKAAGERLGAPVPEGMVSNSKLIQKLESSVTKSPSILGETRNKLYQKGFDAVDDKVSKVLMTELPEEVSKAEVGNLIADSIEPGVRKTKEAADILYNLVSQQTQFIPVDKKMLDKFAENIMSDKRVRLNKRAPIYKFTENLINDLKEATTLDEIKEISNGIGLRFDGNYPLKSWGYEIKDRLNDFFTKNLKGFAKDMIVPDPQAKLAINTVIADLENANELYKPFRDKITTLAEGLGLGKISGPSDFLIKIRDVKPEQLVNKIYAKENAEFVKFMAKEFPSEFKLISDFQKRELLKSATKRDKLKTTTVIDKILGLPKELRNAMFSKADLQTIQDAKLWLNNLPENVNISNTSQGIQFNEYWQNPGKAALITLTDAMKISMIKALKSGAPTSAAGFKAMGDYVVSAHSGMSLINKAATNVVLGKEPFPVSFEPKEKALKQLDQRAFELGMNPRAMIDASGDLGYYMPDESVAMAATLSRVTNYLNSVRPTAKNNGMLGQEIPPSQSQLADYKRTLQIAEQPLIVLKKIQKGMLTSKDIKDLNAMYPEVRNMLLNKITKEIINVKSEGKQIPFSLRKSLSLFTGMPLDKTLEPQSIQAAQATYQPQQQPQAQLPQMAKKSSRVSKLPSLTETDQQRRMMKQ